ncbi:MAG: proton-conducting transporter membrane subunit [Terriglobia bacterium]|nr:proton-conducting transporter membrane subunit [Terriglobia bacterium]
MGLIVTVFLPLLAALLCWLKPLRRIAWSTTVICLSISFALAVMVAGQVLRSERAVAIPGWFEADGLSALVILLVSFVCTLAAIFAGGYMRHDSRQPERLWWFYCNYNLLVFALIVVPAFASPNLVWVGVELITLFAILLVGFESTPRALEAAWKYAILTLMGAPISLLGFFVLYWAYRTSGGGTVETWQGLYAMAPTMPPNLLKFSFLLVFVGFGTKVGLAPMHIWLPDAHSQAPTPICAVLSGIKTTVPLYAILRLLSIILASPEARMGKWMVVIGLFSVGIAAFLLLQVRDYKRMFAFSTVEHMGIILVAAGFATREAASGAVFQMLSHSITKSLCFYAAGLVLMTTGTRQISEVRGLFRISPFTGGALLLCSLAIAGAPPFPIFLSEFSILSAGLRAGHMVAVLILAALIVIAFVAILLQVNGMLFGKPASTSPAPSILPSCRTALLIGALPVVVLGVYIPGPLRSLLALAAQQLGGH